MSASRIDPTPRLPLTRLSTPELFVVASLRLWALPRWSAAAPCSDWRAGLMQANIDIEGILGFSAFCSTLVASALEPVKVHAVHCPHLGEHEAWVLQVLSLMQHDQLAAAEAALAHRCAPVGVRLALDSAQRFARALEAQRLRLPCRLDPRGFNEHVQWRSRDEVHPPESTLTH